MPIHSLAYFCRMENEWFATWFNTPYYHQLYKHRDMNEARSFIDRWLNIMNLPAKSHILDLACGRGRHAVHLHSHGYRVSGLDLSDENIQYANTHFKTDGLSFFRRDMRNDLGNNQYDVVVNLFTSFGYFDDPQDNVEVFSNIYRALKPGGWFLFDYLNAHSISNINTEPEHKTIEGNTFSIKRGIHGDKIVKSIHVQDGNKANTYYEKVSLIYPEAFYTMLQDCGFTIEKEWGDYELGTLDNHQSPRFIALSRK